MAWAHRPEAPSAIKEMAVFVDEEAGWRSSDIGPVYASHFESRPALNTSGIPFDLYFLDDLRDDRLPDYKVYVLLMAASMNQAQLDALKTKVQKAGKVLVVYVAHATPGIGSPDFYEQKERLERELTTGPHRTHWLTTTLTAEFLHDVAVKAGIGTHGIAGQVTHVGAGVAVVHRLHEGSATVRFAEPVDLIELDGTTVRTRRVMEWEPAGDLRRADVIFYR